MSDLKKHDLAYQKFKNIRNRIGRLNGEDLLKCLLLQLNDRDAATVERQQYFEIWHLLLLVKWTILYGDFTSLRRFDPVSDYKWHTLLDRLKEMSDHVRR